VRVLYYRLSEPQAQQSFTLVRSYLNTYEAVELEVLRACKTALSGGTYSFAVGGSGRLAGSTEGFLTTAEVSNVLREAEAPL